MKRLLQVLGPVTFVHFSIVWAVQMYLSFYGPPSPSVATGAVYRVVIHGGVTYATMWQRYFASQFAIGVSFALMCLYIVVRRKHQRSQFAV